MNVGIIVLQSVELPSTSKYKIKRDVNTTAVSLALVANQLLISTCVHNNDKQNCMANCFSSCILCLHVMYRIVVVTCTSYKIG